MGWGHNPTHSLHVPAAPLMARMMMPSPLLPAPSLLNPYQRKMWWMPVHILSAKLAPLPSGLPSPVHPASGPDSLTQGMPDLCPHLIMPCQV